jgi:hypothetical protein
MDERRSWGSLLLFAVAMAWMEAATVFYLRVLIDRVEPYQPQPLPVSVGLGRAELLREAATLIMLWSVGRLAGSTSRSRLGYSMAAFGLWDILYYVFLRALGPWPRSVWDWDVLFLLPLPWWGPVLAPVAIAALMVVTGALLTRRAAGRAAWTAALAGAVLALGVFMADSLAALPSGPDAVRNVLPSQFHWGSFLLALGLLSLPAWDMALPRRGPFLSGLPFTSRDAA